MATQKWLEEHRVTCIDCGKSIDYRSLRCYFCENKRKHRLGLTGYHGKFKQIITKEILINLYGNQLKNLEEIAKIFNCKKSTIYNYLINFNIPTNPDNRINKIISMSGKNSHRFGKPPIHGKRIRYKDICFRSSWEVAYAKYLDKNQIKWLYESKTFDLGNCTYTPDFYLPEKNEYIEIKGYLNCLNKNILKKE
jgi:hypothetical protein